MSKNIYKYIPPKSANEEIGFLSVKGRISLQAFLLRCIFVFSIVFISNYIFFECTFPVYEKYVALVTDNSGILLNEFEYYFALQNDLPPNDFYTQYRFFAFVNFLFLPLFSIAFILIQSVKRLHDTDNSGWFLLIPFYNIYLLFINGTAGANRFGVDPKPIKKVKYFDELKKNK